MCVAYAAQESQLQYIVAYTSKLSVCGKCMQSSGMGDFMYASLHCHFCNFTEPIMPLSNEAEHGVTALVAASIQVLLSE